MGDGESHKQHIDRELIELLTELRVALPGVQTLFAFLLVVPFSNGRRRTNDCERDVYVLAVLATTLSTLLLIAPSAQHRLEFREGDKEALPRISNRCAIAGIAVLAVAMTAVLFLIVDVVLGAAGPRCSPRSRRSRSPLSRWGSRCCAGCGGMR